MGLIQTLVFALGISSIAALPVTEDVRHAIRAESEWDVIVVGAGPAGIIVADRMSEAGKKTLLIEQGGPSYYFTGGRERPDWLNGTDLSRVDVPGLYKSIFSDTGNLTCGDKLNSFGGCTIGGSTSINAGLFFQPPASDFDQYFPEHWKSKDVAKAIAKVRAKQPFTDLPSVDGKRYSDSGYEPVKKWLVGGANFSEVEFNEQPNKKVKVFGRPEFYYQGGQRSGPTKTYLQSALNRTNFHLMSGVQVKRVIRDGSKATGLVADVNGAETTISVSKGGRVVLSGGALFSPQLLYLSGIGPEKVLTNLTKHGLLNLTSASWINNTAVGKGLFDNPNTFIQLRGDSIKAFAYNYSYVSSTDKDLYLKSRSGPYAFAGETSAFWSVIKLNGSSNGVGVQGTMDSVGYGNYTGPNDITLNIYGTSGMKSTGQVTLNMTSSAPGPNDGLLYSHPEDAEVIATFIRQIFDALPGSGLTSLNLPQNSTKDEIVKYITTPSAYAVGYVNHWSSSCRLGECIDVNTVVKGTQNLHVVDSSIVAPLTTNPSFGIMIAAERAVERILALK